VFDSSSCWGRSGSEKLNPALSNADWQTKRAGLAQHRFAAINVRLVEAYASGFDESSIADRSEHLARHILAIWPGPTPASWPGSSRYKALADLPSCHYNPGFVQLRTLPW
jgi:hypothetical protein